MINIVEIIVKVNGVSHFVDLGPDGTNIPLTYSINDIKDISQVKGAWSKSIVIPASARNIAIWNNIQDPSASSKFNPNDLSGAIILADSAIQLEGNYTFTEILLSDGSNNRAFTLNVYGDSIDIYSQMGDKELSELVSINKYNHVYGLTAMNKAWATASNYTLGYDYPMIDFAYGWTQPQLATTGADIKQFLPAVYIRPVFDEILAQEGYKWTSTSLTQSTPFDRLIMPSNNGKIRHSDAYIDARRFKVSLSTPQLITNSTTYAGNQGPSSNPINIQASLWNGPIQVYTQKIRFNNETPPVNGDPNNLWNSTTYEYVNNTPYPITQKFCFNFDISQQRLWVISNILGQDCYPNIQLKVNGVAVTTSDSWFNSSYVPVIDGIGVWKFTPSPILPPPFVNAGGYDRFEAAFKSPKMTLQPGDVVTCEYTFKLAGRFSAPVNAGTMLSFISNSSFIWNEVDETLNLNEPFDMVDSLPKKFKNRDFVLSIIKSFNLVVEQDKLDKKLLRIETTNAYYDSGEIDITWQKKICFDRPIIEKVLGDTQNRKITLKYKDDKDYYNVDYTNKTKETYGQYQYDSGNKNVKGEKKIEISFSPTPICSLPFSTGIGNTASPNMVLPVIAFQNGNNWKAGETNVRMLIRNPNQPAGFNWKLTLGTSSVFTTKNVYAYSGHVDNPANPKEDINFEQTLGLYYPQTIATNNTLGYRYWERTFDEIYNKDSKIITAYVNLNSLDIAKFRFNKKFPIDFYGTGIQYYRVNEIKDYDPSNTEPCQVEFIKIAQIRVPKAAVAKKRIVASGSDNTSLNIIADNGRMSSQNPSINSGHGIVIGENSSFLGDNVQINGDNSHVAGNSSRINGNNSTISSDGSSIDGNNSRIGFGATSSHITGDNSNISDGASGTIIGNNSNIISGNNSIIIGNNVTTSQEGQVIISGNVVINDTNWIQGGYDIVLDEFSSSPINWIQGGYDQIRGLGSQTNINWIQGGYDEIS